MKVAITGPTGWIGSGVLSQLVGDSSVTSILALSRRKLSISSPKLSTLVKADFTTYTPIELEQLKDCDAMLWCMGNGASKVSNEEKEKVLHDYPHTFLDSLLPHLQSRKTPLRFIWIGGQVACRDQQAKLWYLSDLRKTLGRWEDELLDVAKNQPNLEVYVINIGFVTDSAVIRAALGKGLAINRTETARAFIRLAREGCEDREIKNVKLIELAA